jgi:nucleoside-diphosphate-sugar epimerase
MCRKVAAVEDGGTIEVWGDGTAMRVFTYVDDLVEGIHRLMQSDMAEPTNIGSDERVSVNDLVNLVAEVAGKTVNIRHVDGPVGVHARNHSSARIRALGWTDRHSLRDGLAKTYPWVREQTEKALSRGELV